MPQIWPGGATDSAFISPEGLIFWKQETRRVVMEPRRILIPVSIFFGLLPAAGWCQVEKKLSAREIFYSAPAADVATKKTEPPKVAEQHKVPKREASTKRQQASTKKAKAVKEAASKKISPPPKSVERPGGSTTEPEAQYVPASYSSTAVRLGLRYSILEKTNSGSFREVDPDATFHAGDRIRLRVEVNDRGYLYIIHRGTSGVWKPLFPSPEIAGGDNVVERGRVYDIPPGYVFTFDEQSGVEKLFVVLSRQPQPDLEKLIYSLSQRQGAAPTPAPETAAPAAKTLLAENFIRINDDVVDQLRNAYARDLIIEKVDEETPGPRKEKAVYAVAASRERDSRVVVDVNLNHQ
jgi:hypothetical protein